MHRQGAAMMKSAGDSAPALRRVVGRSNKVAPAVQPKSAIPSRISSCADVPFRAIGERRCGMRLHIQLELEREAVLPVDHNHELLGLVYRLLATSDADYAHFLHEEGYREGTQDTRRSKLFTYCGLRVAERSRRRLEGGRLVLRPGPVDW